MKIQIMTSAFAAALYMVFCSCTPTAGGGTQQAAAAYQSTETVSIEYCSS